MAARAREIVSAGSAQARLGAALRNLRMERGVSQAGLGVLIHCSADLVRRIESTERFPSRETIEACDQALQSDGALADLWPAADEERRRSPSRGATSGTVSARFAPEDSSQLIAQWSASGQALTVPVQEKGRLWVTEEDVALTQSMLAMFRQLDHVHGAGPFASQLSTYIDSELTALLSRPVASSQAARSRARVATGFLELAGYQAVDSGRPGWAQSYYKRALVLTTQTADRAYGAYLVAVNLGHLALHCDHPEIALSWSQAASAVAGTGASPATRAAISAVSARAHARMGNEPEATALLLQSETLLDASIPGDEPPWAGYFTRPYLADEIAHCLHDLGRAPAARDQVADALDGVGRDRVRRLAIDAALLASTWVRSGDLDRACAAGREAVGYAARTSSGRCIDRVSQLLLDLAPHAGYQAVTDLHEYVREVLPAAARGVATTRRRT
ncbi:transcriptional regulator with XRE-family HTH domain [Streptacidiphilus sp. BW17]|uniref:helix-turn-helix domain-containing protein n=1 Tax=unclassified Streptacidiphilus TaxID=2643834 RepID=UPI00351877FE